MSYFLEGLKKYAVFEGRATRSEYWYFALFSIITSIIISIVVGMIFGSESTAYSVVTGLYALFLFLPSISLAVRRLHDTDRSGWMALLWLIPVIGTIWLLVLFVTRGTAGDNRFGADRLA
jgi:uncharacterized membrane protein YhaH (DUF805 family)